MVRFDPNLEMVALDDRLSYPTGPANQVVLYTAGIASGSPERKPDGQMGNNSSGAAGTSRGGPSW